MRDCIEGLSKIDKHDSRQTIINNTFLNIVKNINYSFLQNFFRRVGLLSL